MSIHVLYTYVAAKCTRVRMSSIEFEDFKHSRCTIYLILFYFKNLGIELLDVHVDDIP